MKQPTWKDKLRYQFDNLMSRGVVSLIVLLFAITAVVVMISGILTALINGEGVLSSMWVSLMHAIDAGTIAGDAGSFLFMLLMSIVTLCGLFITSMLIGVINTGLESKMDSLRKGHSLVLEKDHVILLGFNEAGLNILRELVAANENQKDAVVVVMDDQDKSEMEDLIHQRIPDTKSTRIICRSGRLDSFADLKVCSPETCRSIIINVDDDFMSIKAILACAGLLENSGNNEAYITALVHDEANAAAAKIAGGDRVEVLYFQNTIARIIAHTCRQPGMSAVFSDLLCYEGDEIYVEDISAAVGHTMREINLLFPKSTVIGILRDGVSMVNPPMDTVIEATDRLILIAEDDGISIPEAAPAPYAAEHFAAEATLEVQPQKTMILGCSELLPQVLMEQDAYAAPGSSVIIAANEEKFDKDFLPAREELRNLTMDIRICDIFDRTALDALVAEKPENIMLLTDPEEEDEAADAKTLLLLLNLRDIASKTDLTFTVTSEMRSVQNQELAQVTHVNDFVISSNITALMMTQISQSRHLHAILDDLLDEDGSELYMKPASRYIISEESTDFYTVCASAARFGEIAVGYKKILDNGSFKITLNPPKKEKILLTEQDSLIVIAED